MACVLMYRRYTENIIILPIFMCVSFGDIGP